MSTDEKKVNIAVIGAGIGGCSCAYFLTELFKNNIEIDVYEKSSELGGRMQSFVYNDEEYECGVESEINPHNLYMEQLRRICSKYKYNSLF